MDKNRIELLDFWRGLAIVTMVIYHALYDIEYIFDVDLGFFSIETWYFVQQFICWSFIFVAGLSVNLSRNPQRNAIKVIFFAIILTVVTFIVTPELTIRFGVLHLIGLSSLFTAVFLKNDTSNLLAKGIGSFIIFFLIWKIGLFNLSFYNKIADLGFMFPFGFYGADFASGDYFPLLPWFFLFTAGFYIGKYVLTSKVDIPEIRSSLISKIGKHSLPIYLLHQVIIFLCLTLLRKLDII